MVYDVIVIGGGASGMMAAGRAAELGKSVLLLEKNNQLGKKLLITGGGRCNLTNNKPDIKDLIDSYPNAPKALYSIFSRYSVNDTLEFFHNFNMPTKVEDNDRVFPTTDSAKSVFNVLKRYISNPKLKINSNCSVLDISRDKKPQFRVSSTKGVFQGKSCIIATGGLSRPETGSTGDGYKLLKSLGHEVKTDGMSLVPLRSDDKWIKPLQGVSLKDVGISLYIGDKCIETRHGKVLFTHFGLSGPAILNLGKLVGKNIGSGNTTIKLDLFADQNEQDLKSKFNSFANENNNKLVKNAFKEFVPKALAKPILDLLKIDDHQVMHQLRSEDRKLLLIALKNLPIKVSGLMGTNKAVVTSGGVSLDEVDLRTMESKVVPGLYIIGDLLDIDRPTGGYSLQLCWSTGYIAGSSC